MTYIKDFSQVGRGDLDKAGGKGANLGELARAGFPVPPGFVLTTAAYQDFVNANGIAGRILEHGALPAGASNDDYRRRRRPEATVPQQRGRAWQCGPRPRRRTSPPPALPASRIPI